MVVSAAVLMSFFWWCVAVAFQSQLDPNFYGLASIFNLCSFTGFRVDLLAWVRFGTFINWCQWHFS